MPRLAILVLIFGTLIIFLNLNLVTIDEADWIAGGEKFLAALERKDWPGTYVGSIAGHPGITTLYLSAATHKISHVLPVNLVILHRFVFSAVSLGLAGLALYLLRENSPPTVLALSFLYWLINPYLLVGLEATWTDQLLIWLSLVSLALFLKRPPPTLLTGLTVGLALLTKTVAVFLIPTLFLTAKTSFKTRLLILGVSASVYFLFYPAMWSDPLATPFNRFLRSSRVEASFTPSAVKVYSPKVLSVDPVIAIGVLLFLWNLWKRQAHDSLATAGLIYLVLIFSAGLFLADRGNGEQAFLRWSGRYLAPAIPFFSLSLFSKIKPPRLLLVTFILLVAAKLLLLFFFG